MATTTDDEPVTLDAVVARLFTVIADLQVGTITPPEANGRTKEISDQLTIVEGALRTEETRRRVTGG